MGKKLVQLLGFVFEGAFKLGFLSDKLPREQYRNFVESLFYRLKDEYENNRLPSEHLPTVLSFFENLKSKLPYSIFEDLPPELRLCGLNINESNAIEFYIKLTFFLGYASGFLYGYQHRQVELKKFKLGEEHSQIVWQNADLMFIEDKTLYVVDFKASGLTTKLKEITINKNPSDVSKRLLYIPFVNYGVPLNLSLGQLYLDAFLESFLKIKEKLLNIRKDVFVEIKGFLQIMTYALDYLISEGRDIKEVVLELIYPLQESLRVRFNVGNLEKLRTFRDEVRNLYAILKSKGWSFKEADSSSEVRKERLIQDYSKKIQELLKRIEDIERAEHEPNVDPIDEARKDVKNLVSEFVKDNSSSISLALLHSAGSGKTSSTRKSILEMPGKHIVMYFATRKRIVEKEYEAVEKELKDKGIRGRAFFGKPERKSSASVVHKGDGFEAGRAQRGIIRRIVNEIKSSANNGSEQIWTFATLQSIVNTTNGPTTRHMWDLLTPRILEEYQFHIILDEFFGYANGLFAIDQVSDFAKEVINRGGRIRLYFFDANGYAPELLAGLIKEYKEHGVVPDAVVLCNYTPSLQTRYDGLTLSIHSKHGFPSRRDKEKLIIRRKFIKVKNFSEEKDYLKVVEYIKQTFTQKESSTAFVFLQDKDAIAEMRRLFENHGFTTLVATASSKKSQEDIIKGSEDVILGTSSVSRGLDFSRNHKPVDHIYIVVSDWGIEGNLVEIIQAISRARGDDETESRTKHLHLVYLLQEEPPEYVIDSILSLLEEADRDVIKLIYKSVYLEQKLDLDKVVLNIVEQFLKSKEGLVLVPVPAQYETVYTHNKISQLEAIITFLEDVFVMEKDDRIKNLIRIINSAVHIYTEDIRINPFKTEYYHPYLLIKDAKLYLKFENEKARKAEKLCKELEEVLKKHNIDMYMETLHFIKSALPQENYKVPLLVPVYSIVFTRQVLCKEDSIVRFAIAKRVGRGNAQVMGGHLKLWTRCLNDGESRREYACIPLGEDYPYVEVLSGRFARFPIEFIKELLEV